MPSYVAIIGDSSDNLPGVPGIGPSTAQKLLDGKRDCQDLLDGLDQVKNARVRDTLLGHRAQILHTESLARLREDAPIDAASRGWGVPTPAALGSLARVFEELEFKSLLTRLEALRQ